MSYFSENYPKLSFPLGKPGFRPAQLAAIQSVTAHFFNSLTPAIVVMPTGSGKTTVAAALAFTLQAKRLLILTPSRLLREQVAEKFASLVDLEEIRALDILSDKPAVKTLVQRISQPAEWEALREFDVVVTTVNSISGIKNPVPDIPTDLFDLVIVDEGHHAPAATWARVLGRLENSRQVLLTATPFRRDAKEIRGKIIFSYDIRRAHEDGVFGNLAFRAAWPITGENADEAIARETREKFNEDRSAGLEHLVMVRVDSIERGRQLEAIYQKTGLRLKFISGASALSTVKRTTKELRAGELDGVICVNMFGEGFDLPRLKIAALHSPHRSLAVTLQFIGRFARTTDPKIGRATFIAYPEEQDNELQELWTSGAPWPDYIHNLSASKIEGETATREVLESFEVNVAPELTDLSLTAVQPYFHAKIFSCPDGVDLSTRIEMSFNETIVFKADSEAAGALVFITQATTKPRWITDTRLSNLNYELDIVHFNEEQKLLFICSSRKSVEHYRQLSSQFSLDRTLSLSSAAINRALNDVEGLQFFSVGMRKRQFGGRGESYRTLAGPSADRGVDEVDGQYYDRGHSFGEGRSEGKEITLGISSSSKIWSNTVRLIPDFVAWCDALASKIGSGIAKPTGSGLDRLSAGEPLEEITERVLFGIFSAKTYLEPPIVFVGEQGAAEERGLLAEYEIEVLNSDNRSIHFRLRSEYLSWDGRFSLDQVPLISGYDASEEEPRVGGRHGDVPMSDYLTDLPPRFYTESMAAIEGASRFPVPLGSVRLDEADFRLVNWAEQQVNIELEKPQDIEVKGQSIFAWLEDELTKSAAEFVFNDDGAGEVADYIAVENSAGAPVITLYHCKASSTGKPGSRVADLYDVCGQAVRCGVWIAGRKLLDRVDYRIKSRGTNGIRKGSLDALRQAFAPERRQNVRFRLVIVQPGLSLKKLREGPHQLLVATKSYATAAAFDEFQVIGSVEEDKSAK